MDKTSDLPALLLGVPAVVLVLLGLLILIISRLLYICRPDEVLIFSGRKHKLSDGRTSGFRVVQGGRAFRLPFIEQVERMDISLISVSMTVVGAYSEGGIPLSVHAIANVKVSSDPLVIGNAIERFLGRGRAEIARVAKETFEGNLRGVLATMTPEEVNEDRLKFANKLSEEAEDDLHKLGLQLDILKIQHVSDDREYLESIGRKQLAEILRVAGVSESDCVRSAEEAEAATRARSEVARTNASAAIQKKQNQLRQIKAELDAEARSEEERATAAAQEARSEAEHELQTIRGQLEQIRLAADVTIPAEIQRKVRELYAAGKAATIAADGEAMAQALAVIAEAWRDSKGQAMDMFVMQHLDEIFAQVTKAAGKLKVGEVNLVDAGDGKTIPAYVRSYPATVAALLQEMATTLGVDIPKVIGGAGVLAAAGLPAESKPITRGPTSTPPAL
jgi:flotillin